MFQRYAVYYTPNPGPLAAFGAAWLGWDLAGGAQVAHPVVANIDVAGLTETPRKYGFHGTLKPPFRLHDGTNLTDLQTTLDHLTATRPKATCTGLQLAELGEFLALVPAGETAAIDDLAAELVQQLDHFRAPASEAELTRRRQNGLTQAQEANLQNWGYPYVMDEFRFHMTLTGCLPPEDLTRVMAKIDPMIRPILPHPFRIDSVTLAGEDRAGLFHEIHRYTLSG